MNQNSLIYRSTLEKMVRHFKCNFNDSIIAEMCLYPIVFDAAGGGTIEGSSESYLKNEFEWYKSMDLSIKNHPGIEKNPIWKGCATDDGNVNSNYGWCVYSEQNCSQFNFALKSLLDDMNSRRAVIIYTRPTIHVEQCDGVHANQDMMCTCYTMFLIRGGMLQMHVHMRSNDIWFGLRYDFAWQYRVYYDMLEKLNTKYSLLPGYITWIADSLHLYKRNEEDVKKFLESV